MGCRVDKSALSLSIGFVAALAVGQSATGDLRPSPPPEMESNLSIPPTPLGEELPRDPGNALVFPNEMVDQDTAFLWSKNEPTIAVDPTGINYVAGANDYRFGTGSNCGYYFSNDSAQTWHDGAGSITGVAVLPLQGKFLRAGDPSVAFDFLGRAYYSCLNYNFESDGITPRDGAVYVFRSVDGGQNYSRLTLVDAGVRIQNFFPDRPRIATDSFNGNIYIAWARFKCSKLFSETNPCERSDIFFAGSNRTSFVFNSPPPQMINEDIPGTANGEPVVAAGAYANQVYVAWLNHGNFILVTRSDDGGTTFPRDQNGKTVPLSGFSIGAVRGLVGIVGGVVSG